MGSDVLSEYGVTRASSIHWYYLLFEFNSLKIVLLLVVYH